MKDTLYIPETLNVGYQNRKDTYTGKLAYVVYTDKKGRLRKEKSWNSWCSKDIEKDTFKNEPTSGFVLNKDVGGVRQSYGWDARLEKVRVYDPRGFEFEIGIPNLLFILQECSAIKGKGLEGEFIYAWDKTSLVLLPVTAQEYQESIKFTDLQGLNIKKDELKEGFSYLTRDKEEIVYLGEHIWYGRPSTWNYKVGGKKKYVFAYLNKESLAKRYYEDKGPYKMESDYLLVSDLKKIAKCISEVAIPAYADIYTKLTKKTPFTSRIVELRLVEGKDISSSRAYRSYGRCNVAFILDDKICTGETIPAKDGFDIYATNFIEIKGTGQIETFQVPDQYKKNQWGYNYHKRAWKENISKEEVLALCHSLIAVTENGIKTELVEFEKGDLNAKE